MKLKQKLSLAQDRKALLQVATAVWRQLDCPRALTCYLLARNGEWDQLVELECDPSCFPTTDRFHRAYIATSLVRKYDGFETTFDRKQRALDAWLKAEHQCKEANLRLLGGDLTRQGAILRVFRKMVENIESLLGVVDQALLQSIVDKAKWGKGSTSSCKGVFTTLYDKGGATPHCTAEFGPDMAAALSRELPFMSAWSDPTVIPGGRLDFVPKTAKIDRAICIEPHINAFIQRGIGVILRDRLRRWGLDLEDQASRNGVLAQKAYTSGLCTIDLSAASDTISSTLVRKLLPDSWALLLERARSHRVTLPNGLVHELEKHSSMGNGYTFELETLIFASATRAAMSVAGDVGKEWGVYGDDIICPHSSSALLIDTLEFLGFTTNREKTFLTGCFFESCGQDFYEGTAVRPFFFKESQQLPKYFAFLQWAVHCPLLDYDRLCAVVRGILPSGWRHTSGPLGEIAIYNPYPTSMRWDPLCGWAAYAIVVRWEPYSSAALESTGSAFAAVFISRRTLADRWGQRYVEEPVRSARRRGRWVQRRCLIPVVNWESAHTS